MELLRKMVQNFRRETCLEKRVDSEGVVVDEVQTNVIHNKQVISSITELLLA